MKLIFKWFIITLLTMLSACTAAGTNYTAPMPASSPSSLPALKTIEPAPSITSTFPPVEESPMPSLEQNSEETETPETTGDSDLSNGTIGPVGEVNLSKITSEPLPGGEPVVMPKPGVPDLEAAIGHTVSQDLARRLGTDISRITVLNVEAKEWSDSSLGCPAPGMNYLMVITPGYQVILEASGQTYTYHTDRSGNYVLCGADGQPAVE